MRIVALLVLLLPLYGASLPTAKPEEVGLSSERLRRIHEAVQSHIESHDISGAVTLVMRKGRLAHLEAHGLADVDSKKPVAKNSLFRVWSMSKPVTGAAILMLMEEGKLRLTDPVSRFIPEFKGMKVAEGGPTEFTNVAATREITIQDLLTHVSGLGSGKASDVAIKKTGSKPGRTLGEWIPLWGATPLDFQPGSKWTYSPLAAFDTLGRVVEVASGMSFDQFLRQRLFDPLGMAETSFVASDAGAARIPTTYHRTPSGGLEKTEAINKLFAPTYFSGGGGLIATAEEYAKFAEMLLEGGQWNGKRILSPRTVELMASVFVPDTMTGRAPGRSFGLSVQVVNDPVRAGLRVSAGSYGWDGAYGTHFWIDPKEKLVGILMIQTDNPNRQLDRDFENAVMQSIVE